MRTHTVLTAVLALAAVASATGHVALPAPTFAEGQTWSYQAMDANGTVDAESQRFTVRVAPGVLPDRFPTTAIVTEATTTQPVENGTITVNSTTRLHLRPGTLDVMARETLVDREGTFRDAPVRAASRNFTLYHPPLPLAPAPGSVGDRWGPETVAARAVVNVTPWHRTDQGGAPAPRHSEARFNVTQQLTVVAVENVTTPAGEFRAVVVERQLQGAPGTVREWWAPDLDYMAKWERLDGDGNRTGGAALVAWEAAPASAETSGFPWPWVLVGAAVVAGAVGVLVWRRRS